VASWKKRRFPQMALSTRIAYEKLLRLYFSSILDCPMRRITAARVDQWLDELKDPRSWTMQSKKRKDFRHELSLLSTVLSYYDEYFDDEEFRYPIKKNRHMKAIKLGRSGAPKPKDFPEHEFQRFRDELRRLEHGRLWAALATVQYYQAFRISEIAGLHYEDLRFDDTHPEKSRIRIVRSVVWPRLKGRLPFVQDGFKNVDANDGFKEQPMFPETFAELKAYCAQGQRGLVFHMAGQILEYRWIQVAYNRAFKKAGLPYRSTHVLRHGGCRRVFNDTKGDRRIAGQLLGNTSSSSIETYAKAYSTALTELVERQWKEFLESDRRARETKSVHALSIESDCNWIEFSHRWRIGSNPSFQQRRPRSPPPESHRAM
jgi:integrase